MKAQTESQHGRKSELMEEMRRNAWVRLPRTVAAIARIAVFAMIGAASVWPALVVAADDQHEIVVTRNVDAKMRDGVTLRADIYRPKAEGKFPVLLVRTPYDKQWISGFGHRA